MMCFLKPVVTSSVFFVWIPLTTENYAVLAERLPYGKKRLMDSRSLPIKMHVVCVGNPSFFFLFFISYYNTMASVLPEFSLKGKKAIVTGGAR